METAKSNDEISHDKNKLITSNFGFGSASFPLSLDCHKSWFYFIEIQ